MDAYEKIKCARMAERATARDYIHQIFTDFTELHGDRACGDDHAVVGGIAWLNGSPVTVIGIEKGHTIEEKIDCNFGCALPEGYRKALRLMKEAEKFHRPVVCIVDTQGANPGKEAERRGAGQAIANNLYEISTINTPIISVFVGEGGSGGALALGVADEVWMLENAYYSVVSPEACASILFKDSSRVAEAAEHLHLFANNLYDLKIIERIIEEPADFTDEEAVAKMMENIKELLIAKLPELEAKKNLLDDRYEKFRKIGRYSEIS